LKDYLDVLRRQWWLILAVGVLFGGAAYAYTKLQDPTYTAEASLSIRDISRDFDLLSSNALPTREAPETLAIIAAEQAARPRIAARVKKALKTRLTVAQLRSMITVRAEARTSFVVFEGRSSRPRQAAAISNEFARQYAAVTTRRERARYARAANSLRSEFRRRSRSGRSRSSVQRQLFEERVSRIEALEDFARPVETARRAEVPKIASSPRPRRDTMLGLILGMTIGILLAFARDALDRRMKGAHDIEEELGMPVLGYVSGKALGGGLLPMDGDDGIAEPDLEAFRILRANLDFLEVDSPPRSLMVTSALPEEGKTTVAIALAGVYAATGRRTLLLECDLRRPDFANRMGLATSPGLADHLAGRASQREIVQEIVLPWGSTGEDPSNGGPPAPAAKGEGRSPVLLPCITAGSTRPNAAELLNSDRFKIFLDRATRAYDLVIIDTPPLLPVVDTLQIVPLVDAVLLCVRASRTTREQAAAAKAALDHFPDRPTGLVTTGVRAGDAGSRYYSYSYSYSS